MSVGLQMVLVVQGMSMSTLPAGVSVTSRMECVSSCYWTTTCSSIFYNASADTCHLVHTVYLERDLNTTAVGMQYLVWAPDSCRGNYTWHRALSLCYKVYDLCKNWMEAEDQCAVDGGHLIKVDNADINAFVNQVAISLVWRVWAGGSDKETEGTYVWADNSPIQATFWDSGQPNTASSGADCLAVMEFGDGRQWRMQFCTLSRNFICQITLEEKAHSC